MPVILRNKTATIEIDRNFNLQHIVTKGSFDVTMLDPGDGISIVWLSFRKNAQVDDNIGLDWREISEPSVASATELRDLILGWNILPVIIASSSLSNVTKVDSDDENVILLEANLDRKMAVIYNNSNANLYIKYGEGASTDSFTVKMQAGDYFELPSPCYSGRIDGIWSEVNGNAMITEIT
jgi:hypothetical protein